MVEQRNLMRKEGGVVYLIGRRSSREAEENNAAVEGSRQHGKLRESMIGRQKENDWEEMF